MVEIDEDLQTLLEDAVRLAVLHVGDEADPAGVAFVRGVVQPLSARRQGIGAPRRRGPRRRRERMLCIQSVGGHLSTPSIDSKSVGPSLAKLSEGASEVIDWTWATKTAVAETSSGGGFFSIRLDRRMRHHARLAPPRHLARPQASLEWSVRLSYLANHDRNAASIQAVARSRRGFFCVTSVGLRWPCQGRAARARGVSREACG